MSAMKQVIAVRGTGSAHWVGDGFPVRNMIPSSGIDAEINPFIMLDYAGPHQFQAGDERRGVGFHPHRGFETVTLAYQGSVEHGDSRGNHGIINPGDVQWMTAGKGILHEEMHSREFTAQGGTFEMIQLWVNLPGRFKMTEPRYQALTADQFPIVQLGEGAQLRVVAGTFDGAQGPAHTFTPVNLADGTIAKDASARITTPAGFNTAIFLLEGELEIGGATIKGPAQMIALSAAGEVTELKAHEDSRFLVMNGEPINEPVVSYGPFVMNSEAEIKQAVLDFQSGKFGRA